MNKRLIMFVILFFSIASLVIVISYGTKGIDDANQENAKKMTIYRHKDILVNNINPKDFTIYKLKENIDYEIVKVEKNLLFYKEENNNVIPFKKGSFIYLYYLLDPIEAINDGIKVEIKNINTDSKKLIFYDKNNENNTFFVDKNIKFKVNKQKVYYIEMEILNDLSLDDEYLLSIYLENQIDVNHEIFIDCNPPQTTDWWR